jgi:hypothetical protein
MDAFKTSGRDSPGKLRKSTTDLVSPLEPTIIIRNEEPTSSRWIEDTHPSNLDADTSVNPSLHYQFTKKDPMGEILLNIYEELTHLAKKTNKTMNTDIDDICEKFHNHNISQARKIQHKILQTTADWEQNRIERELSSCALNQRIDAPENFSNTDKWKTPRDRADTLKLLPSGAHKFSGTQGMSIVEYLYNLNQVQEQCNLSLEEFFKAMLASTTGVPYTYLMGAIKNGESPTNIYHNLLIRYDKRLQPEEARIKLYAYTIPKTASLATAESHIYELAEQAVSSLPAGVARTVALDYEAIQALFRALPPQSATLARNTYSQFSTKVGEGISFADLSRLLNTYRYTIDSDIKLHGSGAKPFIQRKYFNRPRRPSGGVRTYTTYQVQTSTDTGRTEATGQTPAAANAGGQWRPQPKFRPTQGSGGPHRSAVTGRFQSTYNINKPRMGNRTRIVNNNAQIRGNRSSGGVNQIKTPGTRFGYTSDNKRRINRNGNFQKRIGGNRFGNRPRDYCSLCGKYDHKAVDGCPYMVNDAGRKVPIMPCKDVCPACPPYISNRLNHPSYICPYRSNYGPLWNK